MVSNCQKQENIRWIEELVEPSSYSYLSVLPLVYMNSQNRSDFCCPTKKDRKISIFPSDFVQSDLIFAVRVNRGLINETGVINLFTFLLTPPKIMEILKNVTSHFYCFFLWCKMIKFRMHCYYTSIAFYLETPVGRNYNLYCNLFNKIVN